MDKKGQLGLNIVKSVLILFLVLSVIGITIFLTLSSLGTVTDSIDLTTGTLSNVSTSTNVSSVGGTYPTGLSASNRNCVLTVTNIDAYNNSDWIDSVTSGNYTVTGCTLANDGGWAQINNTEWKVTGTYRYSAENTNMIADNISGATTDFFGNSGTIIAILVVVVIILAIAIVIGVVSRFGGSGGSVRSGYGSDTMMGV